MNPTPKRLPTSLSSSDSNRTVACLPLARVSILVVLAVKTLFCSKTVMGKFLALSTKFKTVCCHVPGEFYIGMHLLTN